MKIDGMKIYGEGDMMMGAFIRGLVIEFIKQLDEAVVCKGPPIIEIYASEAEVGKPIDMEINVYLSRVIIASKRGKDV